MSASRLLPLRRKRCHGNGSRWLAPRAHGAAPAFSAGTPACLFLRDKPVRVHVCTCDLLRLNS